jgi:hypothetical protein
MPGTLHNLSAQGKLEPHLVFSLTSHSAIVNTLVVLEPLQKLLLCCLSSWALIEVMLTALLLFMPSHSLEYGSTTSWLSLAPCLYCHPWTSLVSSWLSMRSFNPLTHGQPSLGCLLIHTARHSLAASSFLHLVSYKQANSITVHSNSDCPFTLGCTASFLAHHVLANSITSHSLAWISLRILLENLLDTMHHTVCVFSLANVPFSYTVLAIWSLMTSYLLIRSLVSRHLFTSQSIHSYSSHILEENHLFNQFDASPVVVVGCCGEAACSGPHVLSVIDSFI